MLIYNYTHYKKYPNVLEVFFYFDLLHHCKIISFHFVRMSLNATITYYRRTPMKLTKKHYSDSKYFANTFI